VPFCFSDQEWGLRRCVRNLSRASDMSSPSRQRYARLHPCRPSRYDSQSRRIFVGGTLHSNRRVNPEQLDELARWQTSMGTANRLTIGQNAIIPNVPRIAWPAFGKPLLKQFSPRPSPFTADWSPASARIIAISLSLKRRAARSLSLRISKQMERRESSLDPLVGCRLAGQPSSG